MGPESGHEASLVQGPGSLLHLIPNTIFDHLLAERGVKEEFRQGPGEAGWQSAWIRYSFSKKATVQSMALK